MNELENLVTPQELLECIQRMFPTQYTIALLTLQRDVLAKLWRDEKDANDKAADGEA